MSFPGLSAAAAPVRHVRDADNPRRVATALDDLALGLARWRLPVALASLDIRNRYRGSVLGPMWLTLSTAIMLGALGLLYSALFKLTLRDYLPFLAASLIIWNVLQAIVADGCTSLVSAEGIIRQLPLPYTIHALRGVIRNALTAAHSLPLVLVVFAACGTWSGPGMLLAVPALLLLLVNAFAATLFLGMVCARFRDIGPIVQNLMQLTFFVSPVIWKPELLGEHQWLLPFNPFYVLMELVRAPLLSGSVSGTLWLVGLGYSALACGVAFLFFVRFRGRIAFWV